MLRIQLLFSMIALFVPLCSSICRLPPNVANVVAVFLGSPIRYNRRFNARCIFSHHLVMVA